MKTKMLALALAVAWAAPALPAQTTQKITAGKASDYGLIYSLPRTAFDIYIEAELSEEHPGEYYNYARRHLGITDAITKDAYDAKILSVTIVPRGVADPDNRWTATFKPGATASMTLTAAGVPVAINGDGTVEEGLPEIPVAKPATPSPLDAPEARHAVTQEMARSSSAAKKAELAAQRIFELRETRSDLLAGQADNPPADGKAMQLVLDNLSAQEAALTAMFAGVRTSRTVVGKVSYEPDSVDANGVIVARLSAVDGIIKPDNLAGSPISLDFKILENGELPLTEKGEYKTFPKGGVAYRIPGRARLSINYDGRTVSSQELPVAQLGPVFGLNPALFTDKKAPYTAAFDPSTGAVIDLAPLQ